MTNTEEGGGTWPLEVASAAEESPLLKPSTSQVLSLSDSLNEASSSDSAKSERSFETKPYIPPRPKPRPKKRFKALVRIWDKAMATLKIGASNTPVFLVFGFIILDFYELMLVIVPERYEKEPVRTMAVVGFFIPVICLLLISYTRAIITSSAVEDYPTPSFMRRGACTRCWKCSSLKPLRAHHCSVCNKCVLKMDHHCPWVHNCVGFYNYKFFCLFIFYSVLGCLIFLFGVWSSFAELFLKGGKYPPFLVAVCLFTLVLAILLLWFGGFHFSMILNNMTTVEYWKEKYFDKGSMYSNFVAVFGPQPELWFLPVQTLESHMGWGWNKQPI